MGWRLLLAIAGLAMAQAAEAQLVGTWHATNLGLAQSTVVVTFLPNGEYVLVEDGSSVLDSSGKDGVEFGTYLWDSITGAFSSRSTVDTNGEWGLSHAGVTSMRVNGDNLTVTSGDGSFQLARVAEVPNSIVGSWYGTNLGSLHGKVMVTLLPNGQYFLGDDGDPVPPPRNFVKLDGMERGTYTWNRDTSAFSSSNSVNTDGEWGLSHPPLVTSARVIGNTLFATNAAEKSFVLVRAPVMNRGPTAVRGDLEGNGRSDILWRHATNGQNIVWYMNGATRSGTGTLSTVNTSWAIAGQGDFNADGKADILWRGSGGESVVWLMNGAVRLGWGNAGTVADANWKVVGVGDFNADGKGDVLWRHAVTGQNRLWLMSGTTRLSNRTLSTVPDLKWKVVGVGDFDADGKADILWRHELTGENIVWRMNGATRLSLTYTPTGGDRNWKAVSVADFDGNGKADILWRHAVNGQDVIWFMNGATRSGYATLSTVDLSWSVVATGDYNGDGKADILWRAQTGQNIVWLMNGATRLSLTYLSNVPDTNWKVVTP